MKKVCTFNLTDQVIKTIVDNSKIEERSVSNYLDSLLLKFFKSGIVPEVNTSTKDKIVIKDVECKKKHCTECNKNNKVVEETLKVSGDGIICWFNKNGYLVYKDASGFVRRYESDEYIEVRITGKKTEKSDNQ